MDILDVLLHSPTFWKETVVLGTIAAMMSALIAAWAVRAARDKRKLHNLRADERGAAEASDFALTFPFVLLVAMLMAQSAMAANASLVTHYAAYSAARSARVYVWERTELQILWWQQQRRLDESGAAQAEALAWYVKLGDSTPGGPPCQRAADAARLALVAATPSIVSGDYPRPTGTGCNGSMAWAAIPRHMRWLAAEAGLDEELLLAKARYAFSPNNTRVEIALSTSVSDRVVEALRNSTPVDALPVTASVTFQYPLMLPVGHLFGSRASDGLLKRELTATVSVL